MTIKDLTNRQFGKLVAIEPTDKRKYGCVVWKCICRCDKKSIVYASSHHLLRGDITSCGCVQQVHAKQMGLRNRKNFGCMECGNDRHYAKGLCKNCYNRMLRRKRKMTLESVAG